MNGMGDRNGLPRRVEAERSPEVPISDPDKADCDNIVATTTCARCFAPPKV